MKSIQMKSLLLFSILISLTGCGHKENMIKNSTAVEESGSSDVEIRSEYTIEDTTEVESQTDESMRNTETTEAAAAEITNQGLSEDAREIQYIADNFSAAYFSGDTEEIKKYLTDPYDWDIEVYADPGKSEDIREITITGISDIETKNVDDVCVIAIQYKESVSDDMVQSLTIELIKKPEGWKIQFYGMEG